MIIRQILTPGRTHCDVSGVSKKKVLESIAETLSREIPAIKASELFEALIARERLGTTGLGHGIALPHCRFKSCPEPTGLLARLGEPVDFDAVDREPVDLVFALIVPEGDHQEHLDILKNLAERFNSEEIRVQLRQADNAEAMFAIITSE